MRSKSARLVFFVASASSAICGCFGGANAVVAAGTQAPVRSTLLLPRLFLNAPEVVGVASDQAQAVEDMLFGMVDRANLFNLVALRDINAILEHEKRKDLLGCDSAVCASEIAGALGVRYLLTTRVRATNTGVGVSISLIDTAESTSQMGQSTTTLGIEPGDQLEGAIASAVLDAFRRLPNAPRNPASLLRPQVSEFRPTMDSMLGRWSCASDFSFNEESFTGEATMMISKTDSSTWHSVTTSRGGGEVVSTDSDIKFDAERQMYTASLSLSGSTVELSSPGFIGKSQTWTAVIAFPDESPVVLRLRIRWSDPDTFESTAETIDKGEWKVSGSELCRRTH